MSVTRVNELVRGRRGVTAPSVLRLGRLLGTVPMFWMNLQANWNLWHAQEEATATEPDGVRTAIRPLRARVGQPISDRYG